MKKIFFVLTLFLLSTLGLTAQSDLLIEAESFTDKGGWVVDPRFVEQMGSPYLMAHGMGKQVADAKTQIKIPKKGKYKVWVRTKNWAPGKWDIVHEKLETPFDGVLFLLMQSTTIIHR